MELNPSPSPNFAGVASQAVSHRRVLLIDEQAVVRAGLRQALSNQPGFVVCGEASSVAQGLEFIREQRPDVVVTDTELHAGDAFELIRLALEISPTIAILVLSKRHESMYAERLLRAGARGYVMKAASLAEILQALQRVSVGDLSLSDSLVALYHTRFLKPEPYSRQTPDCALDILTTREFQIFQLSGRGLNGPAIAGALSIRPKTVESHRQRIRGKLGLLHTGQFARCAAECASRCRLERSDSARCELDPRYRLLPGAPTQSRDEH